MRRCFARVVLAVLLICFVGAAQAIDLNSENYAVYEKDAGGGAKDLFVVPKNKILILHGDIATPITYMADVGGYQVTLYSDGSLGAVSAFALNANDLEADASYSLSSYLVHSGDLSGDGDSDLLLQGSGSDSSFVVTNDGTASVYHNFGTDLDQNQVSVAVYNYGGSAAADVVVTESHGGVFAYISDGTQVASSFSTTEPEYSVVGAIAGQFRVNEQGAAGYSVPIKTAQGTAGVKPEVSLNYTSNGGNGVAGMGWSFSGLSSISRCRQTLGQDGKAKAITWSTDDRFCMDGQRLILISGDYGEAGSNYRTEIDSYSEISYDGNDFTVVRKDGSVSQYGNSSDSKHSLNGKTLSWLMTTFKDSVGNPIKFTYLNDSDGHRIDRIDYAYGTNTAASGNSGTYLKFHYENRPDATSGYIAGELLNNNKRLSAISSFNDGVSLRHYQLDYKPVSGTNKTSHLVKLWECVSDGANCMSPTTFEWEEVDYGLESQTFTLNLYGQEYSYTVETHTTAPVPAGDMGRWQPADINGDGLLDMVWERINYEDSHVYYHLRYFVSNGAKLVDTNWQVSIGCYQAGQCEPHTWHVLDYNGDGRQDILVYDSYSNGSAKVYLSEPQVDGSWKLPTTPTDIGLIIPNKESRVVDVNSDGLLDIVYYMGTPKVRYLVKDPGQLGTSTTPYHYSQENDVTHELVGQTIPDCTPTLFISCVYQSLSGWFDLRDTPQTPVDFNGDGMIDIIGRDRVELTFSGNIGILRDVHNALIMNGSTYTDFGEVSRANQYANFIYPFNSEVFADFNGDGLTDLAKVRTIRTGQDVYENTWIYRLSDGTKFGPEQEITGMPFVSLPVPLNGGTTPVFGLHDIQAVDYNYDGYPDLLWHDRVTNQVKVRLWTGNGFDSEEIVKSNAPSGDDYQHAFMDMNGDSRPDYVQVKTGSGGFFKVFPSKAPSQTHGVIGKINNGMGNETVISYELMSQTDHYQRLDVGTTTQTFEWNGVSYTYSLAYKDDFYEALYNGWDLPASAETLGKTGPVLEFVAPINLVTKVESTAPVARTAAGNVNYGSDAVSSISYYYGEAKLQASGRGLLGFHSLETLDNQSGVRARTVYRQDFPFIGSPLSTTTTSPDGRVISTSYNDYTYVEVDANNNTGDDTKYYQTYVKQVSETLFDPDVDNTELSHVVTDTVQDSWGNVTDLTVSTYTDSALSSLISQVDTDNQYVGDADDQRFGRLSETTVLHARSGSPAMPLKTSTFTYYGANDGVLNNLLKTETIEPSKADLTLTTTYEYDGFGNKKKIITGDTDVSHADNRYTRWEYDSKGRYVDKTFNTYNSLEQLTSEVITRDKYGSPTEVHGLNGQQSYFQYDIDGREIYRSDNTGAWAQTDYSTDGLVTGAQYKVVSTVAGGGSSSEHFDALGRSIAKSVVGFDGRQIWSYTEYDSSGRVKYQSTPQYIGDTFYWAENNYDALGRLTSQHAPDSSVTSFAYSGLTTTVTNSLLQTVTTEKDVTGKDIKITDHFGGTVEYIYTSSGQLSTTTTTGVLASAVAITIEYDDLDRKIKMIDPDKGTWFYSYNRFGELENQYKVTSTHLYTGNFNSLSNTQYQRTHMVYDKLGRLVTRHDYKESGILEGTAVWTYDTATNGIGQLASVQGGGITKTFGYDNLGRNDSMLINDGNNLSALMTTSYDSLGRVSQQTDAIGSGSGTVNHYDNSWGYLSHVTDLASGEALSTVKEMDARGNVIEVELGNGLTTTRTFDHQTGRLLTASATSVSASETVLDLAYSWDTLGNLLSRHDKGYNGSSQNNHQQSFCYDGLNRLLKTNEGTLSTSVCSSLQASQQDQEYDALGNITRKVGVGTYTYGSATEGPHAVKTTSDGIGYHYDAIGNMDFDYSDSNGNGIHDNGEAKIRQLVYSSFDKTTHIEKGNYSIDFSYDADRSRWKRIDNDDNGVQTITYYLGSVEKVVSADGTYQIKRSLGSALWTHHFNSSDVETSVDKQFVYYDALGSINKITDHLGSLITSKNGITQGDFAFDAWGKRIDSTNWQVAFNALTLLPIKDVITTRGFTGHEMLDAVGIIHMNGRIYDARLARFLQADIQIDGVAFTQGYNRYSYGHNNPLNGSDPSGYGFFREVFDDFLGASENPIVNVIVHAALYYTTGGIGNAYYAAAFAGTQAYEYGGSFGQALGAAFVAGVSTFALTEIGGNGWQEALMAGMIGGVAAELQGGKFGHGFVSAGAGAYLGGKITGVGGEGPVGSAIRTGLRAVLGGTVSKITGGKFANGAASAAFSSIFSEGERAAAVKRYSGPIEGREQEYLRIVELMGSENVADRQLAIDLTIDYYGIDISMVEDVIYDPNESAYGRYQGPEGGGANDPGGIVRVGFDIFKSDYRDDFSGIIFNGPHTPGFLGSTIFHETQHALMPGTYANHVKIYQKELDRAEFFGISNSEKIWLEKARNHYSERLFMDD